MLGLDHTGVGSRDKVGSNLLTAFSDVLEIRLAHADDLYPVLPLGTSLSLRPLGLVLCEGLARTHTQIS